jgi:hypothetical protein
MLHRKLFVFEFLLGISRTFQCSVSALQVKVALLLPVDVFQPLVYVLVVCREADAFKPKLFPLIIFYNLYFLITKLLAAISINLCTYISYHCIIVGVTVSIEPLLCNGTGIVLSFVRVFCLPLYSCLLYNWSLG